MQKIPQQYKKDYYWLIKDKYHGTKPPAGKRLAEFEKDTERLLKDEPLDYIIGWKPFLNCKIDLSYKPHAPVPETEFWVEKFIKAVCSSSPQMREGLRRGVNDFIPNTTPPQSPPQLRRGRHQIKILDAFSGSGCIGIAVLKTIRKARVDFAEYEPRLIKQIKYNLKINRISSSRYKVIHSNILENVRMSYDVILANPPYVPAKRKPKMKPWAIKYWPQEALFGGYDGLYFIRRFLKQAKNRLNKGGSIWLEFDSKQKKEIEKLIKQNKYSSWKFHRDQYKRWRYVIINL
jgi:release factor glutamine methyltransferase